MYFNVLDIGNLFDRNISAPESNFDEEQKLAMTHSKQIDIIESRINNINNLIVTCTNLNVDEIYKVLTDNTLVNPKSDYKPPKPYLGSKLHFQLPDPYKLRFHFNRNIKNTIIKILANQLRIKTIHSISDIYKSQSSVASAHTNLPRLAI